MKTKARRNSRSSWELLFLLPSMLVSFVIGTWLSNFPDYAGLDAQNIHYMGYALIAGFVLQGGLLAQLLSALISPDEEPEKADPYAISEAERCEQREVERIRHKYRPNAVPEYVSDMLTLRIGALVRARLIAVDGESQTLVHLHAHIVGWMALSHLTLVRSTTARRSLLPQEVVLNRSWSEDTPVAVFMGADRKLFSLIFGDKTASPAYHDDTIGKENLEEATHLGTVDPTPLI